jgi:hypothetical protein
MPTRTEVIQALRARDIFRTDDMAIILDYLEQEAGSSDTAARDNVLRSWRDVEEYTTSDLRRIYDYVDTLLTPAVTFVEFTQGLRDRDFMSLRLANYLLDMIDAACSINCGGSATLTDATGSSYTLSGVAHGLGDSKVGMIFAWLKSGTQNGTVPPIFSFGGDTFGGLSMGADSFTIPNGIRVEGADVGGSGRLRLESDTNLPTDGSWVAIFVSWDLATPGSGRMYLQTQGAAAVDVTDEITFTDTELDLNGDTGTWMGNATTNNLLDWEIPTLVVDSAVSMDFALAADREKFVTAAGQPVDIGDDAAIALGQVAEFYRADGSIVGDAGWTINATEVAPTSVDGPGA